MPPSSKSKSHKQRQNTKTSQTQELNSQTTIQESSYSLPFELQQIILNTFATAFPLIEDVDGLKQVVQEVKGHLFKRDFAAAFGQDSYLQAYAVRWSAARALSYAHILARINREYFCDGFAIALSSDTHETSSPTQILHDIGAESTTKQLSKRIFCIGGGAGAEFVALAACHRSSKSNATIEVVAIDSANWDMPLKQLSSALVTPPHLPVYASEAAKARPENKPLLEDSLQVSVRFLQQDVLSWDHKHMSAVLQNISLCTIMFTLNELFSASLPKTTSFLLTLTEMMPAGSLLLVVDSPGSYSEIQLGKRNQDNDDEAAIPKIKKYPMKWLLDHTLLDVAGKDDDAKWEKIESEDSLWFRIEQREKLRYPVELENMRYQLHLYRRL